MAAYFGVVFLIYGDTPLEWYRLWVALYQATGRAVGIDLTQLWDLALANTFRLDRPFMAVVLISLPVFAWWTFRSRDRIGLAVLALGAAFVAQCAIQSDYPFRKMVVLVPFVFPIALGGMLRIGAWREQATDQPRRQIAWFAWLGWVIAVAIGTILLSAPSILAGMSRVRRLVAMPSSASLAWQGPGGSLVLLGSLIGVSALIVLILCWQRQRLARSMGLILAAAMIVPLVALDGRYVFTDVETSYRDAMVEIAPDVDGTVTAGGHSYAMQLYNTSRAVLEGYPFGMTKAEYEQAVVRYFAEGRASLMFAYADGVSLERWQELGFTLVRTYPIVLPKDHVMGMYKFGSDADGT
jgi:hypothetical protein